MNLVTAHDGFTLNDLVSYDSKHNEDNGEENRDGHDHNLSANHGAEGLTDDPEIAAIRVRQRKNLLATLFVSRGVPMFCAGDDVGHTQGGNNNAYCQDNEIGWINRTLENGAESGPFITDLVRLRNEQPALRRTAFREDEESERGDSQGLCWFNPSGQEMSIDDWENSELRAMTIRIDGRHRDDADSADLLVVLNGAMESTAMTVPGAIDSPEAKWQVRCNTAICNERCAESYNAGETITLLDRSLMVLVRCDAD